MNWMKIAIDTSPLHNANSTRGVGYYTKRLIDGLKARNDSNKYIFTKDKSELQQENPDLIHYPFFDLFFLTLPPRKKTPIVVTVHDVTPLVLAKLFPPGVRGNLRFHLQKNRLKSADMIVTDSICSKNDIMSHLDIPEHKIEVVYLACDEKFKPVTDVSELKRVKDKYNLPDTFFLRVGDINKHKNFGVLFDAFSRISDAHLVLVGKALAEDAPLIPELKEIHEQIQAFSLQKKIITLGFVPDEDIAALYSLARGTIQNSLYEGFGLTALESLSCGTPVIAGDTGSQPEIVGNAGILINPYDVLETSKAIEQLAKMNQEKFNELKEKGITQSKKFSLKKMIDETVSVYESIKI